MHFQYGSHDKTYVSLVNNQAITVFFELVCFERYIVKHCYL